MKIIMLVPANVSTEFSYIAHGLLDLAAKNNISAAPLPPLDSPWLEDKLANKQRDELLASIFEQSEIHGAQKDLLVVQGLSLREPYAMELNRLIAESLDAAVIFTVTPQPFLEKSLRQLSLVASSYKPHRVMGIIANECDATSTSSIEKYCASQQLPLLAIIPPGKLQNNPEQLATFLAISMDLTHLLQTPSALIERSCTPAMFQYQLFSRARALGKKIILPEGDEPRTLAAANICMDLSIAQPILLGEKSAIYDTCKKHSIKLNDSIEIIEPSHCRERYIDILCNIRHSKGLTKETAEQQLHSNTVLGTVMLYSGEVDGLVSGAIHTTADTIRPALQMLKPRSEAKLVSSIFFMCLPQQVLIYGDCAINPNPTAEELAIIATQCIKSANIFGIAPHAAMLSYSTKDSAMGPEIDKIKSAIAMVKKNQPNLIIDGPLQYDAAIDATVAALKAPQSEVAGKATVFIFPNLDAGNIAYKTAQRSSNTIAVGPILQGLAKPVNDLSRGCCTKDIVYAIAITAVQTIG